MDVVEVYRECGDFYETVRRSGLPFRTVHFKLLKAGVLKIKDKIKFGSAGGKMGGEAEELFQKLVPEAIDANRYWKINNPDFDFMYKDLKIDIKYSSCHMIGVKKNIKCWRMRSSGNYDLIVAFLEKEPNTKLKDCNILLIPNGVITAKVSLEVREWSELYQNFKVDVAELKELLDMYAGVV